MTNLGKLLTIALAALLSACAASGPQFSEVKAPPPGKGVIYLFREDDMHLSGRKAFFALDGKPVAALDRNGYIPLVVDAGAHKITHTFGELMSLGRFDDQTIHRTVDVCSGCTSVVKLEVWPGGPGFQWTLRVLSKDKAMEELRNSRLQPFSP